LGTKLEHNDFSGFEIQPNVRLAWDHDTGLLWMAVSRAVRVPTRLERDIAVDLTDPAGAVVLRLAGNPQFEAERLTAYEIGYRWQADSHLSLDLAAYHNRYTGLASLEFGTPFQDAATGQTVIPIHNENSNAGRAQGIELQAEWVPLDAWRLTGSYTYTDLSIDPAGDDLNGGELLEGATPRHQFGVRLSLDLVSNLAFDAHLRHATEIRSLPAFPSAEGLDEYTELDVRLAWRASDSLELSLAGQNLLHGSHLEFGPPLARGELRRAVHAKVAWRQ
jgi:iron complex outermembrane recepter protein